MTVQTCTLRDGTILEHRTVLVDGEIMGESWLRQGWITGCALGINALRDAGIVVRTESLWQYTASDELNGYVRENVTDPARLEELSAEAAEVRAERELEEERQSLVNWDRMTTFDSNGVSYWNTGYDTASFFSNYWSAGN